MSKDFEHMHELETAAFDWISSHPPAADLDALFSALLTVPYLQDRRSHHAGYVANTEKMLTMAFSLGKDSELPIPLAGCVERGLCKCQDLGDLAVENIYLSGSVREGTDVRLFRDEISDTDVMFQLGPVKWVDASQHSSGEKSAGRAQGMSTAGSHKKEYVQSEVRAENETASTTRSSNKPVPASSPSSDSEDDDNIPTVEELMEETLSVLCDASLPDVKTSSCTETHTPSGGMLTLVQTPTKYPGFYVLHHRRHPDCQHADPIPLSGERIVQLMRQFGTVISPGELSHTGPSVATTMNDVFRDERSVDLVACVQCETWDSRDFGSRPRPTQQPSAELVHQLCATPTFLVPVGFRGSADQHIHWRLSFSRHEYMMYRSLSDQQQVVFLTLKHCRAVVGEPAKPFKSYYLKTALFWLCEYRHEWSQQQLHGSLLAALRYVEVCVRRRYMPLYFWPQVNLLAGRSAEELSEIAAAVEALRRRLVPAALALVADWLGASVPELADRLLGAGDSLTEAEFWRRCTNRVIHDLTHHNESVPLRVVKDLLLGGKIRIRGKQLPFPVCSSLPMAIQAVNLMDRGSNSGSTDDADDEDDRVLHKVPSLVRAFLKIREKVRASRNDDDKEENPTDSWLGKD